MRTSHRSKAPPVGSVAGMGNNVTAREKRQSSFVSSSCIPGRLRKPSLFMSDEIRAVLGTYASSAVQARGYRRTSIHVGRVLTLVLATQACTLVGTGPSPEPLRPPGSPATDDFAGWRQTGEASWYGDPFHGRQTASGEVYDMEQLTAAHQTLPFGTRVRVENLDNGRAVTVRINDRGPFVDGRILDVSRQAARELGMIGSGTARVRITVLEGSG